VILSAKQGSTVDKSKFDALLVKMLATRPTPHAEVNSPHPKKQKKPGNLLVGPLEGNAMVASEGLHPMLVVAGSLPQRLLGNGVDAVYVAKEIDDVLGASEQREIALDDDAIETVVHQTQQAGKQLAKGFHRSSLPA